MKTGLEDKRKVVALAVLGLVAAYFFYANVLAPDSATPPNASRAPVAVAPERAAAPVRPATAPSPRMAARPARASDRNQSEEFHPVLHSKNPEDQIDPNVVDPRIRLDLLAKLQNVAPAGGGRNLFQAGPPPPPTLIGPETKIIPVKRPPGPPELPPPPGPPGPPQPPPPPPIAFKYYGLTTVRRNGMRTAFFMSGEEILIKGVGDMVDRNYRLVSIGLTSAVVEDSQSKRQQTVPLAEEAQV